MQQIKCTYCDKEIPPNGYYCPYCTQQIRCKDCSEDLIKDAKACIMCGALLTDQSNSSGSAVNTFELHETNKNRSIRASFTDNVGTTIAETLGQFAGYQLSQRNPEANKSNPQPRLPFVVEDQKNQLVHEEVHNPEDIKHIKHKDQNDLEKLEYFFSLEDDQAIQNTIDLKAK